MNRKETFKKSACSSTLVGSMLEASSLITAVPCDYTQYEESCSMSSIKLANAIDSFSSASSSQHQSSSSIEKLDDSFFGSFQEHYDYLMDKGLIETCQVGASVSTSLLSSSTISTSSNTTTLSKIQNDDYENMSGNVSFKEFLHQYNELNKWLEQMMCFNQKSTSSNSEKYTNQVN